MDFPQQFMSYLQPDKLHQINVSFVVNSLEKQIGGTATNIAYALSQTLKVFDSKKPVTILGALGKDGKEHLAFFKKNRIRTDGIIFDRKLYSATGTVITDIKDNQIWGYYYGACEKGKEAKFGKYVKKDSLMIVSANHPEAFLAAQAFAIKNQIPYLYDVGMAMSWIKLPDLQQGVDHAAYLIGNDYEISLITKTLKTTVEKMVENGTSVITTLGEKGVRVDFAIDSAGGFPPVSTRPPVKPASLRAGREPFHLRHLSRSVVTPAYKVTKTVDPTGAGDAWRGGFMAGILKGLSVEECLGIGNTVASFAVENYGTVSYRLTKAEFSKRLKTIITSNKTV